MDDALRHARRLRQHALKAFRLAQNSQSAEVARHYRLIANHYAALARLAETGKHLEQPPEHSYARDVLKAAS
ncbi:MAG TPA: hypothetical protein VMA30_11995 [Xanthobacteraceae bacterium]|nr:hypothetical protein [Xanthobacteraceae bacterium]